MSIKEFEQDCKNLEAMLGYPESIRKLWGEHLVRLEDEKAHSLQKLIEVLVLL